MRFHTVGHWQSFFHAFESFDLFRVSNFCFKLDAKFPPKRKIINM